VLNWLRYLKPAVCGTSWMRGLTPAWGKKCSAWDKCFITEMHGGRWRATIIIVNHHLFFADLAIKQQAEDAPDAGILPKLAR